MNQIDTGKFIAGCRKEKGLTQAQLAEKLNITDRAVSKWETGKCMPDSSIMLELCNILGVTVNELAFDNLLYQSAVKRTRPFRIPKSTPTLNWSLRSHFRKGAAGRSIL